MGASVVARRKDYRHTDAAKFPLGERVKGERQCINTGRSCIVDLVIASPQLKRMVGGSLALIGIRRYLSLIFCEHCQLSLC